jgi:hypothetical protein
MQLRSFERAFTQHFLPVTLGSLAVALGIFFATIVVGASLDAAAKIVDASFKIAAVVVGTAWALNRYFTARTDVLQLRVEPVVEIMSGSDNVWLFVCRLDIVNTGKSLTPAFTAVLELLSVGVGAGEVSYQSFHRWPDQEAHPVGPIEPGSWSAVSIAVVLPRDTRVVQTYLELHFETGNVWTWHRHFSAIAAGDTVQASKVPVVQNDHGAGITA